jgi:hypothetical protein
MSGAPPSTPLPFTLGELAIAAWDAAHSEAFVAAELEVECHRWPDGSYESRIAKDGRAQALRQHTRLSALHLILRGLSRHEADFMPLIAVALAAENLSPTFPSQTGDAHERA